MERKKLGAKPPRESIGTRGQGEGRELWEALPRKPCPVGNPAYIRERWVHCGGLKRML